MKSKQRQEIADLATKRFDRMREKRQEQAQQRTGHENLKLILGLGNEVAEPKPEPPSEVKPKIVLYLSEGVNPAEKNFTKYPNAIHNLMADELIEFENILYVKLWRESWGRGKNYCRTSYSTLLEKTSLRSLSTVRRSIAGLKDKRFIILVLDEENEPDKNKQGTLYRVSTPDELVSGRTEEGVLLDDIPIDGVFCVNIVPQNIVIDDDKTGNNSTMLSRNMVARNTVQTEHSAMFPQNIVPENIDAQNAENSASTDGVLTDHSQTEHTFKEDSLKDSLSPDHIIDLFYTGIGQKRISKQKREKGIKVLQELQAEGFSLNDIQFAIEWTLKNAKEKPYDLLILPHVIGQALATRPALEATRKAEAESETVRQEEERRKAQIDALKAMLSEEERADLRTRAENELRESEEFPEAFISDPLIEAKMSEIILREEHGDA